MKQEQSPEIDPQEDSQLIFFIFLFFTKVQKQLNGERRVVLANDVGTTGHPYTHKKKMNLDLNLTRHAKLNTKWITEISRTQKIIKLFEENIEKSLCNRVR